MTFVVFLIFGLYTKNYALPKLPFISYLITAFSVSLMSVWYIVAAPELYCTAISAGICVEVWSFYFFFTAVFEKRDKKSHIFMLFLGSLFGALAFGCRPPVALANIVVIPLLIYYLKTENKIDFKLVLKLCFAALPYVIVGILLMWYNYIRFDSVFEFGQSYQLTVADQHDYGSIFSNINPLLILKGFVNCFIHPFTNKFMGLFLEFPVLLLLFGIFNEKIRTNLKEANIRGFFYGIVISVCVIVVLQILTSPFLIERYKTDFLWLLGIGYFMIISCFYDADLKYSEKLISVSHFLCVFSCISAVVLFFVPYDSNFSGYYGKIVIGIVRSFLLK